MILTEHMRRCLKYASQDPAGVALWPQGVGMSRQMRERCVGLGLLEEVAPPVGMVRWRITAAGRQALGVAA